MELTHMARNKKGVNHPLISRKIIIAWLFVLPGIFFTAWWRYYPILKAMYMSLFDYRVVDPPGQFIGLKNYIDIFHQQYYGNAWKNTLGFLVLIISLTFVIPLIQAIFLSEIGKGRKLFTTIYLIPALVPVSINVVLWKWIFNPDYGFANELMKLLGLPPQMWLSSLKLVKFCIVFPGLIGGGISVLIYLAAILGVSEEIYEAASIDGCTGWKKIRYIVLPNIKFIISIQLLIGMISAMQLLDGPFQMTGGGPSHASETMGIYIYKTAYTDLSFGRANAAAVILFFIIALISIIQLLISNRKTD